MANRTLIAATALLLGAAPIPASAQQAAAREERAEALPAAPGRDEAFGTCSACHAYRLVAAQGLSRERWDETMTLMTEKHGMPKLEGDERRVVLDYLARAHPPKRATGTGGFQVPFAPQ
ncbi:mono/diheme cytochrome c family protein [Methylorubrum rhodinum]|uniref:Mono/diheme cytochrome c family protein n=1 Tax=Methylorubrum rhodinum TaxID=29428 RepID=A0A840ZNN5_9HYPH|nr:hypothetical protein [Methylorubrum rhodinum]MBB5758940.1 mono/diheme cytochrome c family protein [Methylorubrum rhodinum]